MEEEIAMQSGVRTKRRSLLFAISSLQREDVAIDVRVQLALILLRSSLEPKKKKGA
jgi:hypothetical protein